MRTSTFVALFVSALLLAGLSANGKEMKNPFESFDKKLAKLNAEKEKLDGSNDKRAEKKLEKVEKEIEKIEEKKEDKKEKLLKPLQSKIEKLEEKIEKSGEKGKDVTKDKAKLEAYQKEVEAIEMWAEGKDPNPAEKKEEKVVDKKEDKKEKKEEPAADDKEDAEKAAEKGKDALLKIL